MEADAEEAARSIGLCIQPVECYLVLFGNGRTAVCEMWGSQRATAFFARDSVNVYPFITAADDRFLASGKGVLDYPVYLMKDRVSFRRGQKPQRSRGIVDSLELGKFRILKI